MQLLPLNDRCAETWECRCRPKSDVLMSKVMDDETVVSLAELNGITTNLLRSCRLIVRMGSQSFLRANGEMADLLTTKPLRLTDARQIVRIPVEQLVRQKCDRRRKIRAAVIYFRLRR